MASIKNTSFVNFVYLNLATLTYFFACFILANFTIRLNLYSFLCILNLIVIIFFLSRDLSDADNCIPSCLFWIFQFIFLGLTPLSIDWDPSPYFLNFEIKETRILGVIALVLVSNLLIGVLATRHRSQKVKFSQNVDFNVLFKRTVLLRNSFFLLFPILVAIIGSGFLFRRIRYSGSVDFGPLFYIAEALLYVLPVVIFLSYSLQLRTDSSGSNMKWMIIFGLILLMLSNPFANARQNVLLLAIPVIYPRIRNSRFFAQVFCYLVILGSLFLTNPIDRYTGKFLGFGFKPVSRLGDYDAFSQLYFAIHLGQEGLFTPGKQLLGSLLFFVPRNLWSDKPIDSGVAIGIARNLRSTNLSCPWIAEAYVNGGIVLVLALSIAIGMAFRRLAYKDFSTTYLMQGFLCGVMFIVLRGSFLQASGKLILGSVLCLFLIRHKKENSAIRR